MRLTSPPQPLVLRVPDGIPTESHGPGVLPGEDALVVSEKEGNLLNLVRLTEGKKPFKRVMSVDRLLVLIFVLRVALLIHQRQLGKHLTEKALFMPEMLKCYAAPHNAGTSHRNINKSQPRPYFSPKPVDL